MKAIEKSLVAAVIMASGALGGCATVTMGTTQELTVDTEPQAAQCRLERRGVAFAQVIATPGKVTVPRSGDTLTLICQTDGHETATQYVTPSFSGATLGNVIAGGLIGVMIDASSGANNSYPSQLRLILMPTSFDSVLSRDRYFDQAAQRVRDRADAEIKDKRAKCSSTQRELCELEVKQVEEGRTKLLAEVETRRQIARVGAGGAPVAAAPPPASVVTPPPEPHRIASPSSPQVRVEAAAPGPTLPPGTDGVWRGTYVCTSSTTATPANLALEVPVRGGTGQQAFSGQTSSLALRFDGGKVTFTRETVTFNGRAIITTLVGSVTGDTIAFKDAEKIPSGATGFGAGIFVHCTVDLKRGL